MSWCRKLCSMKSEGLIIWTNRLTLWTLCLGRCFLIDDSRDVDCRSRHFLSRDIPVKWFYISKIIPEVKTFIIENRESTIFFRIQLFHLRLFPCILTMILTKPFKDLRKSKILWHFQILIETCKQYFISVKTRTIMEKFVDERMAGRNECTLFSFPSLEASKTKTTTALGRL